MPSKIGPKYGWNDHLYFETLYLRPDQREALARIVGVCSDDLLSKIESLVLFYLALRSRESDAPSPSELLVSLEEIQEVGLTFHELLDQLDSRSRDLVDAQLFKEAEPAHVSSAVEDTDFHRRFRVDLGQYLEAVNQALDSFEVKRGQPKKIVNRWLAVQLRFLLEEENKEVTTSVDGLFSLLLLHIVRLVPNVSLEGVKHLVLPAKKAKTPDDYFWEGPDRPPSLKKIVELIAHLRG